MKIALIGPVYPFRGGIAHYVTSLFQALNVNNQVKIISFQRQYPAFFYPGVSDKDPSQSMIKVEADFLLDPINPLTWSRTNDEILKWQPDLVLINWWVTIWSLAYRSVARRAKRAGFPVIYIVHNVLPHESHRWDQELAKFALGSGDGFIVHSSSQKDILVSLLPDAHPIQIPHPAYNIFTSQRISREEARIRLNLPHEIPIFLFFGIIRPYKGLHLLIEAASILKKRGRQPHILVAGEFWHGKDDVLKKIKDYGLTSQIHLFDRYIPNEEVPWFLSASNVFVAPYIDGSQSGALALASGFGLPAIASEAISSSVQFPTGANLQVIPENDSLALANQMERFIDDPDLHAIEPQPYQGDWSKVVDAIIIAREQTLEK